MATVTMLHHKGTRRRILRVSSENSAVALDATLDDGPVIDKRGLAGGMVYLDTGSPVTSLTYYGSESPTGEFVPLNDKDKNAAAQTGLTAPNAYEMPLAVYAATYIKIVPNTDATVRISFAG